VHCADSLFLLFSGGRGGSRVQTTKVSHINDIIITGLSFESLDKYRVKNATMDKFKEW